MVVSRCQLPVPFSICLLDVRYYRFWIRDRGLRLGIPDSCVLLSRMTNLPFSTRFSRQRGTAPFARLPLLNEKDPRGLDALLGPRRSREIFRAWRSVPRWATRSWSSTVLLHWTTEQARTCQAARRPWHQCPSTHNPRPQSPRRHRQGDRLNQSSAAKYISSRAPAKSQRDGWKELPTLATALRSCVSTRGDRFQTIT